jgi:hypothetical protein
MRRNVLEWTPGHLLSGQLSLSHRFLTSLLDESRCAWILVFQAYDPKQDDSLVETNAGQAGCKTKDNYSTQSLSMISGRVHGKDSKSIEWSHSGELGSEASFHDS